MKTKVTEWGNSHGIRLTSTIMKHLNVSTGKDIELNITDKGVELMSNEPPIEPLKTTPSETLRKILESTSPVKTVSDPYAETDSWYLVITLNPCAPMIREASKGTKGAYTTLAEAKEAARQQLQLSIAQAKESQEQLRQLGIENINYIAL
jgi:antitoxin component of MazEF toxin-antitoxin module